MNTKRATENIESTTLLRMPNLTRTRQDFPSVHVRTAIQTAKEKPCQTHTAMKVESRLDNSLSG